VSPSQKNGRPSAVTRNRLFSETWRRGSGKGRCASATDPAAQRETATMTNAALRRDKTLGMAQSYG
jgi:hypothetical protein